MGNVRASSPEESALLHLRFIQNVGETKATKMLRKIHTVLLRLMMLTNHYSISASVNGIGIKRAGCLSQDIGSTIPAGIE